MRTAQESIPWNGGTISAVWTHPPQGRTYLVLGHGAGGNLHTPGLAQFAQALAARGVGTVRFNFPYADAGRKAPDPQPRLEACYRAVAEAVKQHTDRLFVGGRSMGGRIASHVVARGFPVDGLIFLSYPLHPPGQPQRLRTAHLPKITVPMLFLQGSRDAFARLDLLQGTVGGLERATLHVIEGADHSLIVRGRPAEDVLEEVVGVTLEWIGARE